MFAWLELAKLDEFDLVMEQRKALVDQLGHPTVAWNVSTNWGNRVVIAGELETAERLLDESVQIGLAIGAPDAMLR